MGISSIVSHEKGKKHRSRSQVAGTGLCCSQQLIPFRPNVTVVQSVTGTAAQATTDKPTDQPSTATSDRVQRSADGQSTSATGTSREIDVVPTTSVKSSKQVTLTNFLIKGQVTRAEILWALQGVMLHSLLRSLEHSVELFPVMFPDSDITSRMRMHKDKNAYIVTFGLGPHLQQQLAKVINNCSFYTFIR